MIYLLDTDHISALQGAGEAGGRLTARLRRVAPDDYGTTVITFEEQMRGRLAQVAASQDAPSYAALSRTLQFYSHIALCGNTRRTRYGRWRRCGSPKSASARRT